MFPQITISRLARLGNSNFIYLEKRVHHILCRNGPKTNLILGPLKRCPLFGKGLGFAQCILRWFCSSSLHVVNRQTEQESLEEEYGKWSMGFEKKSTKKSPLPYPEQHHVSGKSELLALGGMFTPVPLQEICNLGCMSLHLGHVVLSSISATVQSIFIC